LLCFKVYYYGRSPAGFKTRIIYFFYLIIMNVGFDGITNLERDLLYTLKQNKNLICVLYLILVYIIICINLDIFLLYYYNN
jgi:hypothetical protein